MPGEVATLGDIIGEVAVPGWICPPALPLCLPFSTGAIPGANDVDGETEALAPAAAAAFPPAVDGGTFFRSWALIFSFS
jgi:hypothetical protein